MRRFKHRVIHGVFVLVIAALLALLVIQLVLRAALPVVVESIVSHGLLGDEVPYEIMDNIA